MSNLPETYIGTSNPIDLCKGFAFFPEVGQSRAGVNVHSNTITLFKTSATLLCFRVVCVFDASVFFGLCGPGFGFGFVASGKIENKEVTLDVNGDVIEGGVLAGFMIGLNLHLQADLWTIQWVWDGWNSPIRFGWTNLVNFNLNVGLDVIGLIAMVIQAINNESKNPNTLLQSKGHYIASNIATWGFYDKTAIQLARAHQLHVEPFTTIVVDICKFFPVLRALNETLRAFYGYLTVGPQIGLAVPVLCEIKGVKINDLPVTNLHWDGAQLKGTVSQDIPNPTSISMDFEHRPTFDIMVGLVAGFGVCKFVNLNFQINWPILQLFGFNIGPGPYTNTIKATVGVKATSPGMGGVDAEQASQKVRVVLAPPAAA